MLGLLALLGVNVLLGVFFISGHAWIIEVFVATAMVGEQ